MRMKNILIIVLLSILMFASCDFEKTVYVDEKSISPHMVINGLLFAGADTCFLHITESRPIFTESTNRSDKFKEIQNAEIDLKINNNTSDVRYIQTDSMYISLVSIKAGDKISLQTKYKDQAVSSEVIVPDAPEIISVDTVHVNRLDNGGFIQSILFNVKLKDKPGQKNYYRLLVSNKLYYSSGYYPTSTTYSSNDPLLTGALSVFHNDGFYGKVYNLSFYVNNYPKEMKLYNVDDYEWHLSVKIQTLSEDLFKYYQSQQRDIEAGWNSNVIRHSNIDGGLGILGACNEHSLFEYKNY